MALGGFFSACGPARPHSPVWTLSLYSCVNIRCGPAVRDPQCGPARPHAPVWMHLESEPGDIVAGEASFHSNWNSATKTPYRMLESSNWSCLWWWLFGYLIQGLGVIVVNKRLCVWHDDPRKHMTRRYSVLHDDKPERLCYSPKPRAWLSKYRNIVLDVFRWT